MTATGIERKERGIFNVSIGHSGWLEVVRKFAATWIQLYGEITSDDLQRNFMLPEGASKNLWGAVFHDPRFIKIGYTNSKRPKAHSRLIRKWGLA